MITKFENFINEACDVISLGNDNEIHYYREVNYAFFYFDDNMKYKPLDDSNLYMNFTDNTHSQLRKHLSEDNDYPLNYVIKHIKFSGRIYLKSKIIAFWDYPNKKELMDIINDIEKATEKQGYPVKIWNNGWRIEIYNKKYTEALKRMGASLSKIGYRHPDYEKFDVPEINDETKLIPVEWYINYSPTQGKPKYTLQQRQLMYSEKLLLESVESDIKRFLYYDKEIVIVKFNSARAELAREQLDDGEMTIYISEICDDIKGSGNAGLLMDKIMKYSDKYNMPLSLRASVNNNIMTNKSNILSQEKLIKAYQRMGFKISEELNRFETDSTAPFMVYNYNQ